MRLVKYVLFFMCIMRVSSILEVRKMEIVTEIKVNSSLLSTQIQEQFFLAASFLEAVPKFWRKYNLNYKLYPRFSAVSFQASKRTGHWIRILLFTSGSVELNPGPKNHPIDDAATSSINTGTSIAASSNVLNQNVKNCIFYGTAERGCGTSRSPQTELLRNLTEVVSDDECLKHLIPKDFTERDLLHNRLTTLHPDVTISHDTQLCSEHRYQLGLGWIRSKKRGDKDYGNCKWKSHDSKAKRLLAYPTSWQVENGDGQKKAIGTPMCYRCATDAQRSANTDQDFNQQHYNNEKLIWETALAPPKRPLHSQDFTVTSLTNVRQARIRAEENIRQLAASNFDSPRSESVNQRHQNEAQSPPYRLSLAGERLNIFNRAMRDISALSGAEWNNVTFELNEDLSQTADRTVRLVTKAASDACLAVCGAIAPDQELDLFSHVVQKIARDNPAESRESNVVLKSIVDAIEASPSFDNRVFLLAQICRDFTESQLQLLSPVITEGLIKAARSHRESSGAGMPVQRNKIVRHKLDKEKVSHFFTWLMTKGYVQIMSWGTLKMQFSSGERTEFGKVVLQNCRTNLIRLYLQDCLAQPNIYEPLHERTLYKIFEKVKYSERHAMSGLDNVAVDAMIGWQSLQKIVLTLEQKGLRRELASSLVAALKSSKAYLQGEYLIHVSPEISSCAYHCRRLALSDGKIQGLRQLCDDHAHSETCNSCEIMHGAILRIDQEIEKALLSQGERMKIKHDFEIAKSAVLEQKAHIIRGVHQDQARRRIIASLDEATGLIIFDYAMKYLPAYYREKQEQFFGKTGLSWEVFSFLTKQSNDLIKATYVVFFSKCDQDVTTSAAVYRFVLKQIKKDFPKVIKIYDRSDNAGTFRSWKFIRERRQIMEDVGIQIIATENSEVQRGKDQADRDIALIKSQLKAFHNSGNDIISASDMKKGCDAGSIPSIKSAVIATSSYKKEKSKMPQGPKITTLLSFTYEDTGVRVRHFAGIGEGVLMPYEKLPCIPENQRHIKIEENFQEKFPLPTTVTTDKATADAAWLYCEYPYCGERFRARSRWQDHVDNADHSKLPVKDNTSDVVKKLWLQMLEGWQDQETDSLSALNVQASRDADDVIEEGFALHKRKPPVFMNEKQIQYLNKLFWDGQKGNMVKAVAADVATKMEELQDKNGVNVFEPSEWLSATKIATYFSTLSTLLKKGKISAPSDVNATTANELQSDDDEDNIEFEQFLNEHQAMNEFEIERAIIPTTDDLLSIDGTLALEPGDYCAIKWNKSWTAAKILDVNDSNQQLTIKVLQQQRTKLHQFRESHDSSAVLIDAQNVLQQLPEPRPVLLLRQSRSGQVLEFPEEVCEDIAHRQTTYSDSEEEREKADEVHPLVRATKSKKRQKQAQPLSTACSSMTRSQRFKESSSSSSDEEDRFSNTRAKSQSSENCGTRGSTSETEKRSAQCSSHGSKGSTNKRAAAAHDQRQHERQHDKAGIMEKLARVFTNYHAKGQRVDQNDQRLHEYRNMIKEKDLKSRLGQEDQLAISSGSVAECRKTALKKQHFSAVLAESFRSNVTTNPFTQPRDDRYRNDILDDKFGKRYEFRSQPQADEVDVLQLVQLAPILRLRLNNTTSHESNNRNIAATRDSVEAPRVRINSAVNDDMPLLGNFMRRVPIDAPDHLPSQEPGSSQIVTVATVHRQASSASSDSRQSVMSLTASSNPVRRTNSHCSSDSAYGSCTSLLK